MTAGAAVIAAEQLTYRYAGQDEPALRGVDLTLLRGHAIGLLGPNGSGKSTLINLLVGLRQPQGGRIRREPSQSVAWVPQEYAFYPELTCMENLRFFAGMLDLPGEEAARRVESAVHTCMLQEFAQRRARHCSGGVRRRLNLGIALLQQPAALLLDEPTAGVDPQSRAFLLDRVRDMVAAGTSVLYATHYMEEVSAVCSHILLLDHGRVLASGDLATLLRGPEGQAPFADLEALFMHYTQRRLRD
ncbi:ABC transporter ATP-binding protein [Caenimonas aquaedulcis]|uniref:ABC transporter ATP-binding protein n=1 Tax=Caenimonas aquaedulcis TaxID=2793270 RepID=A0A931MGT0_9BURK|nr:ABC transporter ATP-binding protein [Caenimonas aquaedulcis]MBG9388456.1 ABC transporter ATP-binding protein [Caenimonas aquaedulcis]